MKWQRSTTGPDMGDVIGYWQELERSAGESIICLLELDGSKGVPRLLLHAFTYQKGLVSLGESAGVSASEYWPSVNHATFDGAMFCLLAWLDSLMAQTQLLDITNE